MASPGATVAGMQYAPLQCSSYASASAIQLLRNAAASCAPGMQVLASSKQASKRQAALKVPTPSCSRQRKQGKEPANSSGCARQAPQSDKSNWARRPAEQGPIKKASSAQCASRGPLKSQVPRGQTATAQSLHRLGQPQSWTHIQSPDARSAACCTSTSPRAAGSLTASVCCSARCGGLAGASVSFRPCQLSSTHSPWSRAPARGPCPGRVGNPSPVGACPHA